MIAGNHDFYFEKISHRYLIFSIKKTKNLRDIKYDNLTTKLFSR
jgi:hypothetical protein